MGGIPVSPEIQKLFENTWLNMMSRGYEPTAKEVLDSVTKSLHSQHKNYMPLPKIRKSQQIVSSIRKKYSETSDEEKLKDKPWTLGACREYPTYFPPSSLLFLMKMQENAKKFVNISTNVRSRGFSIRKAMWIVQLQSLIKEYFKPDNFEDEYQIVFNISEAYSISELRSITTREKAFDTTDLDEALCSQNLDGIFMSYLVRNKKSINKEDIK